MEPSTENQHRKKGTYGFTHMKPASQKETYPLAHFVPQCETYETSNWKPLFSQQLSQLSQKCAGTPMSYTTVP